MGKLTKEQVEKVVQALVRDGWLFQRHVEPATSGAVKQLRAIHEVKED